MARLSSDPPKSEANQDKPAREMRTARGWMPESPAHGTRLAVPIISKMEHGEILRTCDRFMRLGQGLGTDLRELSDADTQSLTRASAIVTPAGDGPLHQSSTHGDKMLIAKLSGKHMVAMVGPVKVCSVAQFDQTISHSGEAFTDVMSGVLTVNIDGRAP